ncbi:MAG: SDR family NAD(P)-dependent oxidoreductase [Myxococcota bacterium]
MTKTILVTGATDGIGLATATRFAEDGHHVLIHGRNARKAEVVARDLEASAGSTHVYIGDFSRIDEVERLAADIGREHERLDVLINNAGIFKTSEPTTPAGLDVRFVVNTLAPYVLTERLLPLLGATGRVVNLSSAAQAPVDLRALSGATRLSDMDAYAQSKLALTMWSRNMGLAHKNGPTVVAVNPGSLLATKMVKEAFGQSRGGVEVGADILYRAAVSDEFADANGLYFDNDVGRFSDPHPDALNLEKTSAVLNAMQELLSS